MGSVVSATTGRAYGAGAKASRQASFFAAAAELLSSAQIELEAGRYDLALEYAYRAALRVAGARNAASPIVRKRKRLPTSAWDKLALTGDDGAAWARTFSSYSAARGRAASGIDSSPDPEMVTRLVGLAGEFYSDSLPGGGQLVA